MDYVHLALPDAINGGVPEDFVVHEDFDSPN